MIANVNETRKDFEIFNYKNLGSVRTYIDDSGEPWFCLIDVCDVLGISNNRDTLSRLNEKGVGLTDALTNGGKQRLTFINEGNLYRLIGRSRKKEANNFMNWVFDEILPNLRKAGQQRRYNNINGISYSELDNRITRIEDTLNEVTKFNGKLETAYKYSAVFSLSDREGRKNFINYLREKGVLSSIHIPAKKYWDNIFLVEEYDRDEFTGIEGVVRFRLISTITNYGLDYFKDELIKDGYREENIDLDSGGEGILSEWYNVRINKSIGGK